MLEGKKDSATVTPLGERLAARIDGVQMRPAITHPDERGEICEIFNPAWQFDTEPLVYVYATSIRPGRIKGWVYHRDQIDRLFVMLGALKIVLFDMRDASPTKGMINEFHLTERNRGLLRIPALVAHAVQNVGHTEGVFINLPSKPYNHCDPDKYRVDRDKIPYAFDRGTGW